MAIVITLVGAFLGLPVGRKINRTLNAISPNIIPLISAAVILVCVAGFAFFGYLFAQQVIDNPLH